MWPGWTAWVPQRVGLGWLRPLWSVRRGRLTAIRTMSPQVGDSPDAGDDRRHRLRWLWARVGAADGNCVDGVDLQFAPSPRLSPTDTVKTLIDDRLARYLRAEVSATPGSIPAK